MFKLLIVGSRSIENFDLTEYVPKDTAMIISGGAKGVDTLAEKYADKNRIIGNAARVYCKPGRAEGSYYILYGRSGKAA